MENQIQDIGELAARCEVMAEESGTTHDERIDLRQRAKEYRRIQESLLKREQTEQETTTREPYTHANAARDSRLFEILTKVLAAMVVLLAIILLAV